MSVAPRQKSRRTWRIAPVQTKGRSPVRGSSDPKIEAGVSPEVLLARVRAHLRSRRAAGNQRIVMFGDLWLDAKNYATRVKGEWIDLRPQAYRLLVALAQSSGVPVSRRERTGDQAANVMDEAL